jgi:nucleotide-binding universal stress UspA family protein
VDETSTGDPVSVVARRADELRAEPIDWLWPERIPFGAITVIAGDPGLGKSLLTIRLAAQLTRGFLGGHTADAVLLTAEDSLAHVVRPRLEAAEADIRRVTLPCVSRDGIETPFVLPADVRRLRPLVAQSRARLLVVDPLAAHLGANVNSWKDDNVRRALAPLHALADETGAAVVVVAHLNKGQMSDPLQRLGGSIGLAAAARSVLLLGRDPGDPRGDVGSERVLAHVKSNLGPLAPSLKLMIKPVRLGATSTAHIVETGVSPYTASELLAVDRPERGAKLAEAIAFLETELRDGAQPVVDLKERATTLAVSLQTLQRAKQTLGVVSTKTGFGGQWVWQLPNGKRLPEAGVEA